jgi:mono/diheme cytochrome c family protein
MNSKLKLIYSIAAFGIINCMAVNTASAMDDTLSARGRYLLTTSGCNDCHTSNYAQSAGNVPESEWMTGDAVGFQGPWGTTYPSNLRLVVDSLSELQWLNKARSPLRPPMPWYSLRDMSDDDLRAIYYFLRKLGPAGKPAPAYEAPGVAVSTPYFEFVPKNLPLTAKNTN